MARSVLAGLGALALASLLLAGCATTTSGTPEASPTPTTQESATPDPDLGAAWLDNGRMIGLVTLGSSTCVPVADEAKYSGGTLNVTLAAPAAATPCTSDLVPRVTLVQVPEGVDPSKNLPIEVTGDQYLGQVELPGASGLTAGGETDYNPSAGWATVQGQFVILTWGSSSCPPVIQDVAATGPAEVTVTYETPAANQVCTMDMAPRAAVTAVNDLEETTGVSAILKGDQFDNVKIPIYGTNA
ncbi:hypothetical protein AAIB33_17555 [Microbacterium sp. AZCO]|uniref:hypothetical protein n=1 Tax=Microbacterium sp. AZCO TaxID=3142976 RepID=UPI0031F3A295